MAAVPTRRETEVNTCSGGGGVISTMAPQCN